MFDFGINLKKLRKSKKITQKQLALELNITERTIQTYELNEKKPSYETIIALADYFDVSTDYLLGRTDNPNSHKS